MASKPAELAQAALTPHICVHNAAEALEFYTRAFGAEETMRLAEPNGKIGHAEIRIHGALVMLSDEYPDYQALSPKTINGTAVTLHLTVPNVDEFVDRALAAGATLQHPVADQFYGLRTGTILDPFGHRWMIATEIERLSAQEIQRRFGELMKGEK